MAVTQQNYTGNGSTTNYSFTFPYLAETDVGVKINGTTQATTTYSFANATTISMNTAPANGAAVIIFRNTNNDAKKATFYPGSAIKAEDLNNDFDQILYTAQEIDNNALDTLGGNLMKANLNAGNYKLTNVAAPTATTDGANKTYVDSTIDTKIDTALTTDVIGGQSITITDNSPSSGQITASVTAGSIRGTELAGDAVDGTKIADDSIDSEHYIDGSIDTAHIGDAQITHDKLANDCIDGDNIQDDSIKGEHYDNLSIQTAHIADNQITADKLDHTTVTPGTYSATDLTVDAQGRITAASNGTISTSEIGADAVNGDKIANDSINSEHYVDGSIDHVHLANDVIDGDNIQDDVVNSEHIVAGALDNEHYAAGSITADKLNAATVITNSEQSGASANDTSFFTSSASDARYFNISSGDTIKDGDAFPDNDTTIATTAAINDRIIDLVDDVGGFTIIASEQTFPNANPQGVTGQAAVLSIKEATTNLVPTGTTLTVVNGNVANNANITITGVTSTIPSGFGFLIESTSTLHTYTFHRLVPKATEVTTVASNISNVNAVANNGTNINAAVSNASNINSAVSNASNITTVAGSIANVNTVGSNISDVNSFADLYQIATSAPSTDGGGNSLAAGDMWFDSSSNKTLKVHNGTSFQSVSPTQSVLNDISIVSGQITYLEDLGAITDATQTGTGNNINTVATDIANINTVAGVNANVTTVAGIAANVTTVAGNTTNINAVAGNSTNINAVVANATNINTVASNNANITSVAESLSGTQAYAVTVANVGGSNYFFIDSVQAPALNLIRGFTYTFDVSNASNSGHPLRFKDGSGNSYTTGVTTSGTAGQAGATVTLAVASNAPSSLRYYCTAHGNSMGNTITTADSNIGKVAGSIADINRYATEYTISSSTPSSPSSGDLWYDGANNVLKFYNSSSFVGITPGLTDVVNDTTPELGGHLDCNNKNLTEVGTVSGNNLQMDFGTL